MKKIDTFMYFELKNIDFFFRCPDNLIIMLHT